MPNVQHWIVLLLMWNLGLLIAGGILLFLFWNRPSPGQVAAQVCAEAVTQALQANH